MIIIFDVAACRGLACRKATIKIRKTGEIRKIDRLMAAAALTVFVGSGAAPRGAANARAKQHPPPVAIRRKKLDLSIEGCASNVHYEFDG